MKIIILNSGMGTRLGDLTENNPKSLVKINSSETIFSRGVDILKKYCDDFIITTGYLNDVLIDYATEKFPDINFEFVHNPVFDKTHYIKSLQLIGDIDDDVILLHGDLLFSENVAKKVMDAENTSVIVDSSIELPEDDFKAKIMDGNVKCISTKYFGDDAVACQPFYKLSNEDWKLWKLKIGEFCDNDKTGVYAEDALNTLTDRIQINPLDIDGDLCMEVDTKEDLKKAQEILK